MLATWHAPCGEVAQPSTATLIRRYVRAMVTRARAVRDVATSAFRGWLTPEYMAAHSPDSPPLGLPQRAAVVRCLYALADALDEDNGEAALEATASRAHGLVRYIAALTPTSDGIAYTQHGELTLADLVDRARDVLAGAETSRTSQAGAETSRTS